MRMVGKRVKGGRCVTEFINYNYWPSVKIAPLPVEGRRGVKRSNAAQGEFVQDVSMSLTPYISPPR